MGTLLIRAMKGTSQGKYNKIIERSYNEQLMEDVFAKVHLLIGDPDTMTHLPDLFSLYSSPSFG